MLLYTFHAVLCSSVLIYTSHTHIYVYLLIKEFAIFFNLKFQDFLVDMSFFNFLKRYYDQLYLISDLRKMTIVFPEL